VPKSQESDWDKVGWEPRFGTGETASQKEEDDRNLLDHQTWVESKLEDKFFGDWYHNAAVIVFACLSSWLIAELGGGLAWVFIVMAACGTYYRTSIRRVRRNFRDDITREMAKAKLETDHESLEWINSFLVKFWPIYAPQLAMGIVQSVDQVLSTSTPAFLDSMRLKTFTLGTKPPRLEHVKTYPRAEDEIVMMDWKFSFTPTDTMDMTARQLKNKVNPKVVLEIRIGKAMVSKSMEVIVEDFAISGLMRVKMKLQIPFPHIERVDICFLGRPEIDYVCKPLGGDTFGFDINFIPGLETFIKDQIHANLGPMMYDPNVFPIEVAKMLSGNPIDMAIGVLAVTLHGGQGLKNPDKFSGTPDPYVIASLNNSKELGRTKTIHENANPRWGETLYIILTNLTDALTLVPYDYNEFRKDKELGVATFALDKIESGEHEHENLQLEVLASGRSRGLLQCDVRFFPVLTSQKLEDGTELPAPESNTGIARISIEQAKELDGSKSLVGQLNPYGVLLLNGKEIHVTGKLKRTNNPVFPDASKSILVTDRKKARVGLVIKDDRDLAADPVLGTYQVKLDDMMKLMEKGQEWFNLHGTKSGRAKMLIDWKPVALRGVTGGSGGYITPIGVMRIHVKNATDLRNVEKFGKSDPYARVLLSGLVKGRTVTFQNELNPTWDEVIYVPMHATTEKLTLQVMDAETLGKDRPLGQVQINASDYMQESEEGGYLVHDEKRPMREGLRMGGQGAAKGMINFTVSFYPTLNVIDPEEEEEERKAAEELEKTATNGTGVNGTAHSSAGSTPPTPTIAHSKKSSIDVKTPTSATRPSLDGRKTLDAAGRLSTASYRAPSMSGSLLSVKREAPKVRVNVDDLTQYGKAAKIFDSHGLLICHSQKAGCSSFKSSRAHLPTMTCTWKWSWMTISSLLINLRKCGADRISSWRQAMRSCGNSTFRV
jgi:Ca2+-dependent lipid-binding protein